MENEGVMVTISKTYSHDYEQYSDENKSAKAIVEEILADPDLPGLKEIVVGNWGGAWEEDCQELIDGIVENAERFSHIERLYIGDMGFEECEVSWIMQGNYSALWKALPHLKELTIKGSMDLELGDVEHEELESLSIICGGLPVYVIESIQKARLPKLKKLLLYIGVEDYGFDGDADTIKTLLAEADFPALTYLGIADSEIQDELTEVVLDSKFMGQISTLDLSGGTLTDKGGKLLLEKLPMFPNLKKVDLHFNYLTENMLEALEDLPMEVDTSENDEPEEYNGELYMNAMLTE
ncbi:MAG: cytoplasmic protein [Lachnospiraceae bacterium]|nr:cytoplasmic protein [Lachnospiraceae bacterium]